MNVRKWISPGLILGLLIMGLASWLFWQRIGFVRTSVRAVGEVVELVGEEGTGSARERSTTWAPRIRFRSLEGDTVVFTAGTSSNPPAYRVGQRVTVRYRQDNPYDARLEGFWPLWGLPGVLGLLGLGLCVWSWGGGSGGAKGHRPQGFSSRQMIRPEAERYRTARFQVMGGAFFQVVLLMAMAHMWPNQKPTAFLLLGIIGLILVALRPSLRLLLEVRRTGWPELYREPQALRLGQSFSVRLYLPRLPQGAHLRVALVCLHVRKTLSPDVLRRIVRSGESLDSPFVQEVWGQEIQVFTRSPDLPGFSSMALLKGDLPAEGHPSESGNPRERWYWHLRILGVEGRETRAIRFPLTVERALPEENEPSAG